MRAHATTALRAGMSSQPAAPSYDADEIRAATAIVMPTLPAGWDVRDVQVYPSRFRPERRDGDPDASATARSRCLPSGPACSTSRRRRLPPRAA